MKTSSKLLAILSMFCMHTSVQTYHAIIQPTTRAWQKECVTQLSTQEIVTLTDVLLLSYEVVQASVTIHKARLIIQSELLNIVTLSINDTFDVSMQAQSNDLTIIKQSIDAIEQAQERMKFACNALKNFGPLLINIDPTAIQIFISNLKNVILHWAKNQHNTIADLETIKQEMLGNIELFADLQEKFDTIAITDPVEHTQLLQGANSLTDMYKKTENMVASLTTIRQESLINFNSLLSLYFKYHYKVLYDHLKSIESDGIYLIATCDHTLPHPEDIFKIN